MVLHAPVPETPPYWLCYGWQFEGGCVIPEPGVPPRKDNVTVKWKEWEEGMGRAWGAQWGVITGCDPRTVDMLDPVDYPVDFSITGAEVRVRVELDELMLAVDPGEELPWHAVVRRLPFVYEKGGINYPYTVGVDHAPNVIVRNPDPGLPLIRKYPHPLAEPPAIWVPRGD